MRPGDPIDETGMLLREGAGFHLLRDAGGRLQLDLPRTPIDEVGKRVRVIGTVGAHDRIEVDGVALV